jgi:predicted alpha/beta-fold hydrolase
MRDIHLKVCDDEEMNLYFSISTRAFMKYLLIGFLTCQFLQSPAQITTGYFSSFDKTKIYYEVEGSGHPVVLVHGFTGSTESWKKSMLYKDLLRSNYLVISLDLRGNGRSD